MQIITITVTALSIGTHVLAAPAHVKRVLSCIDTGDLTCLSKNSLPVVGDALDPLLSPVEATVEPVLSTLPPVPVVKSLVGRQLGGLPSDVLTTAGASSQLESLTAPVTAHLSPVVGDTVGTVATTLNKVPVAGPAVTDLAGTVVAAVEPIAETVCYSRIIRYDIILTGIG